MIPNVVKGSDMHGLLRYLVSEGRANEHTNPHVISGDGFVQSWNGLEVLDAKAASAIATYLDQPRRHFGTEINAKAWQQNPETGAREAVLDVDGRQVWKDVHVWHCSLSLPPGEVLSAEQWDAVATNFADEMGFTATSGKAPARWVAIHHGPSMGGNDHVHIAASMVREDGTRWEGRFRDFPRAQAVCRELERKHGLVEVDGSQYGTADKGVRPVERATADKAGQSLTARQQLAHRIRAAAVASTNEGEWIRRVRGEGVVIKPRFAAGSTDVVAGYRAALKDGQRGRLDFYSGGQLGNDLSLPRVRENWPEPTLEQAGEAAAEWQAAFRSQPATTRGREARALDQWALTAPDVAASNLQTFSDRLSSVPISDRIAWSDAARDVSGALSAWAKLDPTMAPELRTAAAVIARTAQERRPGGQLGRRVKESPMGTSMILLAAGRDDKGKLAGAVLMAQLLRAATAIRDYHWATGNARQAQAVQEAAIQPLAQLRLHGYRPDPAEMTLAERDALRAREISNRMNGAPTSRATGAPLPNVLTPRYDPAAQPTRGSNHGRER